MRNFVAIEQKSIEFWRLLKLYFVQEFVLRKQCLKKPGLWPRSMISSTCGLKSPHPYVTVSNHMHWIEARFLPVQKLVRFHNYKVEHSLASTGISFAFVEFIVVKSWKHFAIIAVAGNVDVVGKKHIYLLASPASEIAQLFNIFPSAWAIGFVRVWYFVDIETFFICWTFLLDSISDSFVNFRRFSK